VEKKRNRRGSPKNPDGQTPNSFVSPVRKNFGLGWVRKSIRRPRRMRRRSFGETQGPLLVETAIQGPLLENIFSRPQIWRAFQKNSTPESRNGLFSPPRFPPLCWQGQKCGRARPGGRPPPPPPPPPSRESAQLKGSLNWGPAETGLPSSIVKTRARFEIGGLRAPRSPAAPRNSLRLAPGRA